MSDKRLIADVGARRIARVYAEALLNAAEKGDQVQAVFEEYDSLLNDVFKANPEFEVALSSAAMGRTAREKIIRQSFENRTSPLFYNFLRVLNEHERLDLLRGIYSTLRELHDERARRIRVQVSTAVPLQDAQRSRLQGELREALSLEPVLEERVDPNILGGMRVRVGDFQFDATVATELDNIRKDILARGAHEIQTRRDRFSSS
jgi:F-type H+-transporting ATPase subunit delta